MVAQLHSKEVSMLFHYSSEQH